MSRRMRSSWAIAATSHAKLRAAAARQASKIVAWRWPGAPERIIEPSYMAVSIGLAFREAALSVRPQCDPEGREEGLHNENECSLYG
jgi:hypothetical protein